MFVLIMIALAILVQGVPIWFAALAKPIGPKPYRWGTYVAFITGIVALSMSLTFHGFGRNNVSGIIFIAAMLILAMATTVGLLRRQKYGVIAFIGTYLLLAVATPLLNAIRKQPPTPATGQELPFLIFIIITAVYLFKRWKFMS